MSNQEKSEDVENIAEDTRETVVVYADDLENLINDLENLEDDRDLHEKIEDSFTENRIIYLHGVINEDSASNAVTLIHYFNLEDDKNGIPLEERKNIKVYISSEGGEIIWCKKILSAIENSQCKIETIAEGGQIASAGLSIFLAGDIRKLSRHTEPLYHNLSSSLSGTYSEMRNQLAFYDRVQDEMDDYIVERTEIPLEKLHYYRERNLDWHISFKEATEYKMYDIEI